MSDAPATTAAPEAPDDAPEETVHLERLLPGPIERVWQEVTGPDHLDAWLEADGGVITHSEPPQRLTYVRGDESEVTLELHEHGADVRLLLTHRRATAIALPLAA